MGTQTQTHTPTNTTGDLISLLFLKKGKSTKMVSSYFLYFRKGIIIIIIIIIICGRYGP
jgi:hypothetical protein